MTESYSVRLPTGWEGPYTVAELREFLATGKVRSSDRIRRPDGSTTEVSAVLPDAIDISIVRPPPSERIVRKSSDRHAAVARKEASNRLKAVASPAPAPDTAQTPRNAPVASARSPASDRQPTTAIDRKRTSDRQPVVAADRKRTSDRQNAPAVPAASGPGRIVVGIIATLVILVTVGWEVTMLFGPSERSDPPATIQGTWKIEESVAAPALKGLTLGVTETSVDFISPAGTRTSSFKVVSIATDGEQFLSLTPADADFGDTIRILPGPGRIRLGTPQGSGLLLPVQDK